MGLSHRVYLIREGRIVREVDPTRATVDDVLFMLFDVPQQGAVSAEAD